MKLPEFLDSHQRQGIEWILSRKFSYLAHAPGAGKTAQAIIASLLTPGLGQTLFIVPPSLTKNWEREIEKWTERLSINHSYAVVPPSPKKDTMDWTADFIICADSMIAKDWVYAELTVDWKFIAVDEASRFKESTALRSRALYTQLIRRSRHSVLMDGSPMPNRPMELFAPLKGCGQINLDQHEFGLKYCDARFVHDGYKQSWDYSGSSNEEKLKRGLQKSFMHVVTEDKLQHPERRRSIVFMNQDPRSKEHKAWEKKHLSGINFSDLSEDISHGSLARFRRELGIRKIKWVAEYINERLGGKNESLLLFAWHREVCTGLRDALRQFKPHVVMGGTTAKDRESAFKAFQEGTSKLIIGNISAMGRGHNLQRADRVVFAEFSWTDELNKQCEKRASRKGSNKNFVRCDYIVAPESMDEPVMNALFNKAQTVKAVIG